MDGLADLLITGDGDIQLLRNIDGTQFEAVIDTSGVGVSRGSVFGDFNLDGSIDIIASNDFNSIMWLGSSNGDFTLVEGSIFLGEEISVDRGFTVIDFDNDGDEDLILLSGGFPILFSNNGSASFSRISSTQQDFAPTSPFSHPSVADFDNDGFQDIFVSATDESLGNYLYTNNGNSNNYLRVNLEGTTSNRLGIGSTIRIKSGEVWQTRQVNNVNGLFSSNEITAHFGLGTTSVVDSLEVRWTSGTVSILTDVTANQTIEILELAVPSITIDSLVSKNPSPEITGRVTDLNATIEIEILETVYPAVNNGDSTWVVAEGTIDSLANGTYDVIARALNEAGIGTDTTTNELVINRAPPIITVSRLSSTSRSPQLFGTVDEPEATLEIEVNGNTYPATNSTDGTWTLEAGQISPPLEDGFYDVIARATNDIGTGVDETTDELFIDGTPPEIVVNVIGTSVSSPEISGSINDLTATLNVQFEGASFSPEINSDSTWSIPAGTVEPLSDGVYDVVAFATDSLGNIGFDPTLNEVTITQSILALTASEVKNFTFKANWSEGTDPVRYFLDVATDEEFTNFILEDEVVEGATNLVVQGLDFRTTYYYRVSFENSAAEVFDSENFTTVTTRTPAKTRADYIALIDIYNQAGGETWTDNGNWPDTTGRWQDWSFITLEQGRVTEIDLSNNNLTGTYPFGAALDVLRSVNVSDNALDNVEDLSALPALTSVDVSNNRLEFDDLEPLASIESLTANGQASLIFEEATLQIDEEGRQVPINRRVFNDTTLTVITKGSADRVNWYRNDQLISTSSDRYIFGDSSLTIQSIAIDNMGEFRAEIVNDIVEGVTIPVDSQFVYAVADFTVDVNGTDGNLIPDQVDGYLLLTTQVTAGFDTLNSLTNQASSFTFPDVRLGDYLVSIDADREKYVPTYYADAFEWVEADTIQFRQDSAFQVSMTIIPDDQPQDPETNPGRLTGAIFEDFGNVTGRIDARRAAARRQCGLRRRTTGGKPGQSDGFVLYAYGETNDDGEFEFGFLEQGVYRFFVEYPGIPLDESAFVQFEVGEAGISDTEFRLQAEVTENGIAVQIDVVTGLILEYFKNLSIYPNPVKEELNIEYRHLKSRNVTLQLVDLAGNVKWAKDLDNGYDGDINIDVSAYPEGLYFLYFFDRERKDQNVLTYKVIKQR
jgi:hypothetical protein